MKNKTNKTGNRLFARKRHLDSDERTFLLLFLMTKLKVKGIIPLLKYLKIFLGICKTIERFSFMFLACAK